MDTALMTRRRNADPLVRTDLAPISLTEMVERAAMMTRVDRKYAVNAADVPAVLSCLDPDTRVLEIGGIRDQSYRSTYFDTSDLDAFRGTAHKRRRRFKVRTRTYVDSDLAFLEVKTRGARGVTVKERVQMDLEAAGAEYINREQRQWIADRLAPLRAEAAAWEIAPVLRGGYRRTTLLTPGGCGRATIDSGLWWELAGPLRQAMSESAYGVPTRLERPDLVIIETKSGSTPSRLDHLLWEHGHRPARVSKYATAMAALVPGLATNRWNRTLSRHFG